MNFNLDINSLITTGAILVAVWLLKGLAWLLIETSKALVGAAKTLITNLIETKAQVELLDAKMEKLLEMLHDMPKLKSDLNELFKRVRSIENKDSDH
jgi:ascorbate-specific PTS system EIIC-type component UlaA